jgi:hypothetical protein
MAKVRIVYTPEVKAKIVEAATTTKKTGSWKDAHVAAQEIGYKGSLDSLIQFMKGVRKAAKKAVPAKKTVPAPVIAQAAPTAAKPAAKKRKSKAAPTATKPAPKKRKPKAKPFAAKKRNYDAATKAAIVKAALAARNAGEKWPEALVAAKKAGYRAGLVSLMLFVKAAGKPAKKLGRPAKAVSVAVAPKKRGRPAKVVVAAVATLDPVAAQYLVGAIDKAIGELQTLRQQYSR